MSVAGRRRAGREARYSVDISMFARNVEEGQAAMMTAPDRRYQNIAIAYFAADSATTWLILPAVERESTEKATVKSRRMMSFSMSRILSPP